MPPIVDTCTGLDPGASTPERGYHSILVAAFDLLSVTWGFVPIQSGQTVVRAISDDAQLRANLTNALGRIGINFESRPSVATGKPTIRIAGQHTWLLRDFFTLATTGIGARGVLYPASAATQKGTYYFDTAQLDPHMQRDLIAHLGALGLSHGVHMSAAFSTTGDKQEVIRVPHTTQTQVSDAAQFERIRVFMAVAGLTLLQNKEVVLTGSNHGGVGITYPNTLTYGQMTAINSVLHLAGISTRETVLANGKTIPAGSRWINAGKNGYALIINEDYVNMFNSLAMNIYMHCLDPKNVLHFDPKCEIPLFSL